VAFYKTIVPERRQSPQGSSVVGILVAHVLSYHIRWRRMESLLLIDPKGLLYSLV
jgi:hypothetical protein